MKCVIVRIDIGLRNPTSWCTFRAYIAGDLKKVFNLECIEDHVITYIYRLMFLLKPLLTYWSLHTCINFFVSFKLMVIQLLLQMRNIDQERIPYAKFAYLNLRFFFLFYTCLFSSLFSLFVNVMPFLYIFCTIFALLTEIYHPWIKLSLNSKILS